jgi:glucokinase
VDHFGTVGELSRAAAEPLPLLAGDVGGTKTDLALYAGSGEHLRLLRVAQYPSRSHPSLEAMVRDFLGEEPAGRVEAACFAVAGPVEAGTSSVTNLSWTVDRAALARLLGTARVELVNDLWAAAHGMLFLKPEEFRVLRAADPSHRGSIAVIAPGTGLGEAILHWDGARYHPVASEGGHADFAPRDDRQIDLLRHLRVRFGRHVSYERVLSGDGLFNLYEYLRSSGFAPEPPWLAERLSQGDPNAVIANAGLTGECALCAEALDLFCNILGAEAGNLALKAFASGGLIVGGGIAPKVLPALERGGFLAALRDKGRMSGWLEEIGVRVALNSQAPLLGAVQALLADDARGGAWACSGELHG